MDLKLKDVANLLNVSEITICRWLIEGEIPAYQLKNEYRFDRNEIEDWIMRCSKPDIEKHFYEHQIYPTTKENAKDGIQQFGLLRAMNRGGVLRNVKGQNKKEIIKKAAYLFAPQLDLDPDVIIDLILDRETRMSTGVGHGIAIPHPCDPLLKVIGSDIIITVFLEKPIDYDAIDKEPVHTLFFLFSSSDKTHLHLLSKLACLIRQPKMFKLFLAKTSAEKLLYAVKEWELKSVPLN